MINRFKIQCLVLLLTGFLGQLTAMAHANGSPKGVPSNLVHQAVGFAESFTATIALVQGIFLIGMNTLIFFKKIRSRDRDTLKSSLLVLGIGLCCVGYWAYVWFYR